MQIRCAGKGDQLEITDPIIEEGTAVDLASEDAQQRGRRTWDEPLQAERDELDTKGAQDESGGEEDSQDKEAHGEEMGLDG